ncbi:hypothetical protein J2X61_002765 [Bacillus sp. 3255]|nr:hypothetical protein [Bacillus sp. 3255]
MIYYNFWKGIRVQSNIVGVRTQMVINFHFK